MSQLSRDEIGVDIEDEIEPSPNLDEILPHNGNTINKMSISPLSKYVVTYSQKDKNFNGWEVNPKYPSDKSDPFIPNLKYVYESNFKVVLDFKVSDKKVIITKCVKDREIITLDIYDMYYKENITNSIYGKDVPEFSDDYEFINFLTNGDIITLCQVDHQNPFVSIYSSSNDWKRKAKYEIDFGGVTNIIFGRIVNGYKINDNTHNDNTNDKTNDTDKTFDKLYFIVNKIIHILDMSDLSKRQIPIPFEIDEMDIEKLTLKFSKYLMVIKFKDIFYIYSNEMNAPIGKITDDGSQDFYIARDNNIITLNDDKIKIYWKSIFIRSIDESDASELTELTELTGLKFKNNLYGLHQNKKKPWIIDINNLMNNLMNSEDFEKDDGYFNDENVFHHIAKNGKDIIKKIKQLIEDEKQLTDEKDIIKKIKLLIENEKLLTEDKKDIIKKLKQFTENEKDIIKKIKQLIENEKLLTENEKDIIKMINQLTVEETQLTVDKTHEGEKYIINMIKQLIEDKKRLTKKQLTEKDIIKKIKQLIEDEKQFIEDENQLTDKKDIIKKIKQLIVIEDEKQLIDEKDIINMIKQQLKKQVIDLFIKKYMIHFLNYEEPEDIEKQDDVELILEKITSETVQISGDSEDLIINVKKEGAIISSYNTKLSNNRRNKWDKWNEWKKAKNSIILYNEYESEFPEIRIYTFYNNKIRLQCRYNIEFLICAIKNYYNIELDVSEIKKIAKHTENDILKRHWIDYLLKDDDEYYFLIRYGEKLLKSAIKQNNLELMEKIIKKTLKYFKDNPKNIYILSIIFNNVPYLESNYPENLLNYYNETVLFVDSIQEVNNNLDHLHSFCIELSDLRDLGILRRIQTLFNIKHFFIILPVLCVLLAFILGQEKNFTAIFILAFILNIPNLYTFITLYNKPNKLKLLFVVPFPNYVKYPKYDNLFKELFISSPFTQTESVEFYGSWNGEAIINFKWRVFARYYYAVIWFLFICFLACFTLASSVSSEIIKDEDKKILFISSIVLGLLHLTFEIRQFIWNPIQWIINPWNWFDIGAYSLPTVASFYFIYSNEKTTRPLFSISCLLLDIKFLLFFRVFESFGTYFAIIIGVGRRIYWFLFIVFLLIISFAHAFFILLKPESELSEYNQGDPTDDNNPWVLTPKFHPISKDGKDSGVTLVQEPDELTNLFSTYPDSILSMYLFLTGDKNSLSAWEPNKNRIMIILVVLFSFIVIVYLMNLFIGLLNMAIEKDNNRASYLAQKAEIIKDIELFYLLPSQRRWNHWFPDLIYYYADVDKTRKYVKTLMDEGTWNANDVKWRKGLDKALAIEDFHENEIL